MLEEVVVSWWEVRWIWRMRQNFIAQFIQLLKHWLCNMWLGIVVEKNWALSVDQCWLQALKFLVHLINLLSKLLRCNGFTGIQKAVVGQTGSRPSNSDHDPFFGANLALGSCLLGQQPPNCRRISFNDPLSWSLSVSNGRPLGSSSWRL